MSSLTVRKLDVDISGGFGRRWLAWHMAGPVLHYFSPRFHPWQHDNRAIVQMWLDSNSDAYRAVRSTAP